MRCTIWSFHTLRLKVSAAIILRSSFWLRMWLDACSLRMITLEWLLKFSCPLRIYTYLNLFKTKLNQQHFLLSAPQLCVYIIYRVTLPNQDWAMGLKKRENTSNRRWTTTLFFVGTFTWDSSMQLPSVVYG